jgi:hypothetical protein
LSGLFGWAARKVGNAAWGAVDRALDDWGERNRRALLLGKYATMEAHIHTFVAAAQQQVDERVERQRAAGHRVLSVEWGEGWVGDERCFIRMFENGDPTKIELFYGGVGGPMGHNHGHVIIRAGRIDAWLLPGAEGQNRIRLY